MKTPFVDRSLVLPEMWVTGELDVSFTHAEAVVFEGNAGWIDIGGAFGVLDDLEVEAALISIETERGARWESRVSMAPTGACRVWVPRFVFSLWRTSRWGRDFAS